MKRKFIIFFTLLIIILSFTGCIKNVTSADFTVEELDSSFYDLEKYTTPFWKGNIVYNECVFPIMNENNELEPFDLMYDASEIVSVKDYTLQTEYTEGEDYILEDGKLVIIPTGKIYFRGYDYINREEVIEDKVISEIYPFYPKRDTDGYVYWSEEEDIFLNTLAVTYIHNDKWDYFVPKSQAKHLPNIIYKLKNNKDVTIVIEGDSISTGCNASGKYNVPPFAEDYVTMAYKAISDKYSNNKINIINSSVGGATARTTKDDLYEKVIKHNPDMVVVAFGMNDASNNISTEDYKSSILERINYIREELPECEFLLVTSLYGNPDVFSKELYEEHAQALYEISIDIQGVGICDPQTIMRDLMYKKDYLCLMADNMVHPNDYGMRIIAQCVIAALTE